MTCRVSFDTHQVNIPTCLKDGGSTGDPGPHGGAPNDRGHAGPEEQSIFFCSETCWQPLFHNLYFFRKKVGFFANKMIFCFVSVFHDRVCIDMRLACFSTNITMHYRRKNIHLRRHINWSTRFQNKVYVFFLVDHLPSMATHSCGELPSTSVCPTWSMR